MFDHVLEIASKNLKIEKLLIQLGLDPSNITYDAIYDRLVDLAVANLTFSNILAFVGSLFLLSTFVVRTIVLLRVLCIFSIVFFLGSAALAGSVPKFLLYLLALPINVIRLVQIRNTVRRARIAAQGSLSLDWLRPYMTPRPYRKGDVLFRRNDPGTEMFLTVGGKFLVTEIGIEIPPGRMLGELGFISPSNKRTQSVECLEDGDVLTITYEKLVAIYFQNPEFGYFFLRLVSDRLLQNYARLETRLAEDKAKLAALTAPPPAPAAAVEPSPAKSVSAAAGRPAQKLQSALVKRQPPRHNRLFARMRNFMRRILGAFLYFIGWVVAVVVLVQAIILALAMGSPEIPIALGGFALAVWLFGMAAKYVLARRA
jgi:CRP-like cAMP-binding protein